MFATRVANSYRLAEELYQKNFNDNKRVPLWQFTEEDEFDLGRHNLHKRRRTLGYNNNNNTQINKPPVQLQPASNSNSNSGGFTLPITPNLRNPSFPPPSTTTSQVPAGSVSVLLNSLLSQGLISLGNQQVHAGPSAVGLVSQKVHGPGSGSAIGVEFDSVSLKLRHESVITALYSDLPRQCATCGCRFASGEDHSNHMDWHVIKNRSLRSRKTKPSATWFASTDMWLRAAMAQSVGEAQTVPDSVDNVGKLEEREEVGDLPADDEQPACALCRERFEDYYCHEMESWMYKGAVYMYAPDGGSTEGIDKSKLGPIVHAKCRSGSKRSRRNAA